MNYTLIHTACIDECEKIAVSPAWVAQRTTQGMQSATPQRITQFAGNMRALSDRASMKGGAIATRAQGWQAAGRPDVANTYNAAASQSARLGDTARGALNLAAPLQK